MPAPHINPDPVTGQPAAPAIPAPTPPPTPISPRPAFVGGKVLLRPFAPLAAYFPTFEGPMDCLDCVGGLICVRDDAGRVRWYPLALFGWIAAAD